MGSWNSVLRHFFATICRCRTQNVHKFPTHPRNRLKGGGGGGRTLSYSWKIIVVLCPQRVSLALKKKRMICSQRAMLSIQSSRVWQPAAGSNDCFVHFYKNFLLAGSGVAARCWLYWLFGTLQIFCSRLSHLTRSLSKIVCRGQEGPKSSKGTLRPDFQANTCIGFF
jgi:hypothetical protein